jgi:hypothetical protein
MKSTSSVAEILTNTTLNTVTENNNINNTVTVDKSKLVDLIADKLVLALNNPSRRAYYCKVAYKLSEGQIWNNLEQSAKGRDPAKLFTWLCQRELNSS